ncbi:2-aminoethylphosphonate--pyruvate transaminase [Halobacillus sp. Cin3]|uniref:2-aminoethylphosphonate--pyruvate transaminase n=1 Tax=Halobacillus sp. Cin3 TaxID=2928441 RepID=UPI00248E60B7|nr:2-aminoethylphosphonate--pyruvate transaminase [Halobacillus sp. Cin3]
MHNPDHYLLLTPGPLTTTASVRESMLKDWCTWDDDYKSLVQSIRSDLLTFAGVSAEDYSSVLMQGSGTFSVESVISTAVPDDGKLLVLVNGAYGKRIAEIAERLKLNVRTIEYAETDKPDVEKADTVLAEDAAITHVAVVHCETTTGLLNPIHDIAAIVKRHNKTFIVDAMSSFGGIDMSITDMDADYVISSANKCIQGVPGFGFVIAKLTTLQSCEGRARSLSLDLYDQWKTMEDQNGKWRFTSPTHTVRAFKQALEELKQEGGVLKRQERYVENQRLLVEGMRTLGFSPLLPDAWQSPIITPFYYPEHDAFQFERFYEELKARGFVIYPGKVTDLKTFRIGNIGDIHPSDITALLEAVRESSYWIEPAAI